MIYRLALIFFVAVCASGFSTSVLAEPRESVADRMGVYVAVDDLRQARDFYEKLFASEPEISFPGFTGFNIAGGLFAVISRAQYVPESALGARTAPYIKVASVKDLYKRLNAVLPSTALSKPLHEPAISILKVRDPEGNLIEFYSLP